MPMPVGMAMESRVHLALFVSLPMVRQVVEQGQCIREKSMVHTAVSQVQPWSTRSCRRASRLSNSSRLPVER